LNCWIRTNSYQCFLLHSPGIPYNYWSQYIGISGLLLEISVSSVVVGFAVAFFFFFVKLCTEGNYGTSKIASGSLVGALFITIVTVMSLVTVVGLSVLAGVNITGFSVISFVLSVGFSVEYSVHIVSRWLHAPVTLMSSLDRVNYSMEFLMLPTFMSFISSTIGVVCLAFTEFNFTQVYFFRPLIIMMPATYFFGCWWLPIALSLVEFDFVRFGEPTGERMETPAGEKRISMSGDDQDGTATAWQPEPSDDVPLSGEAPKTGEEIDC
jgi:Patched family